MRFDARTIAAATAGRLVADGPAGPVGTDSRSMRAGDWFLPLCGERHDGHTFLGLARAAGCAGAVVSGEVPQGWDRGLVRVGDTLRALQDLAAASREGFQGPVIGITGSVGKTTTRSLAVLALAEGERIHHTEGNLNNHVGLPLTLLARPEDATLLVLELGTSDFREIHRLQEIARPTHRLITCVAAAHLEKLGSLDGVARAKGELFDGARPGDVLCVNDDDPRVAALPRPAGVRVLRYGRSLGCDLRLLGAAPQVEGEGAGELGVGFEVEAHGQRIHGWLPGPGLHMAGNACAALCLALALERPLGRAVEALRAYAPVGARMRLERGPRGLMLLNDAYNANPASMAAALAALAALPATRRVALLGDMLELGPGELDLHQELLRSALGRGFELVGACGPRMRAAAAACAEDPRLVLAPDAEDLARQVAGRLQPGDLVLIKGSRGMAMERVLPLLGEG